MRFKLLVKAICVMLLHFSVNAQISKESFQKAKTVLEKTVAAYGGIRNIVSITDISLKLSGTAYDEGQSMNPVAKYYERPFTAEMSFLPKENWSYNKILSVSSGDLLFDPIFVIKSDNDGWIRVVSSDEYFQLNPIDISIAKSIPQFYPPYFFSFHQLRLALRNMTSFRYLGEVRYDGTGHQIISYSDSKGAVMTMYINSSTSLISKIEYLADHLVYGDAVTEIVYKNYKTDNSIPLPYGIALRNGGETFMELNISEYKFNQNIDKSIFNIPTGSKFSVLPEYMKAQKIAENVYNIPAYSGLATTYNVFAIVLNDQVVVVDAPLWDGYTQQTLQVLKTLAPDKPIKNLVLTHYHTDHLSGVAPHLVNGATVITTPGNKDFINKIVKVKHSLVPSGFSQLTKEPVVETFLNKKIITDGNISVELHNLKGGGHVDEHTVIYLPKEKVLFVADLMLTPYNGKLPWNNESLRFLDKKIKELKLEVETLVPSHGIPVSFSIFKQALSQ